MQFMHMANMDVLDMERAERMREAERFRWAREARRQPKHSAAAQRERRFFFFRIPSVRPREA